LSADSGNWAEDGHNHSMSHEASASSHLFNVDLSTTPPDPTVEVLVPEKAWVLRNVFSPEECRAIIASSETCGFEPINYREDYRRNVRLVVDKPDFASEFYRRVSKFLPEVLTVPDHCDEIGFGLGGTWEPVGLNYHLRICKYEPGGFFCAHADGRYVESEKRQSFFTCMLYLNGDFEGGETRFLDSARCEGLHLQLAPDDAVTHRIRPEEGLVLLFWQPLIHEGNRLATGEKYILRTEVMFERQGEAEHLSEADREAIALFQQAERLEADGHAMEAMPLYRRAARMSKRLADAYKL